MMVINGYWGWECPGASMQKGKDVCLCEIASYPPDLSLQLDQTTDFEERRLIRAAMRELRQRKRGTHLGLVDGREGG